MYVFNIMMSRDLGGIQQAYIDYCDALNMSGYKVVNIASVAAQINDKLVPHHRLPNIASWCILSKIILFFLHLAYKPKVVICHGNRAIQFTSLIRGKVPTVGVSHNYSYKYLKKCDYVICLTNSLKAHLIEHGIGAEKLLFLPNMVRISHKYSETTYSNPVVIGAMGRFVNKKGFVYLLEAIAELISIGANPILLLGGDGEEKENLVKKVEELNIANNVIFCGWVSDKEDFFSKIDIFCLPSTVEPFGIILLEAIEHSKAVIATKSGGPEDIIRDQEDGLLVEPFSGQELAVKMQKLITNPRYANKLAKSAYDRLISKYDIKVVSKKLSEIIEMVAK